MIIYFVYSNSFFFQLHVVCCTQQGGRELTNWRSVKILRSLLSANFWHCVLSGGTQRRDFPSTPEWRNENINVNNYFISSSGNRIHNQSIYRHTLCSCATTNLKIKCLIVYFLLKTIYVDSLLQYLKHQNKTYKIYRHVPLSCHFIITKKCLNKNVNSEGGRCDKNEKEKEGEGLVSAGASQSSLSIVTSLIFTNNSITKLT